jgi:hypothetical protein
MAGQMQAPDRREHRRGVISLDLGVARVQQANAQEVFVHEYATTVGKRDAVPREARKARGDSSSRGTEVACGTAVGDGQASALFDEQLLVGERFVDVRGFGRRV